MQVRPESHSDASSSSSLSWVKSRKKQEGENMVMKVIVREGTDLGQKSEKCVETERVQRKKL